MPALLMNGAFEPGKDNNYLIGGNLCNAFVIGCVGSGDDFFLVGAEPPDESPYPLLTGNVLDSEGSVLFRLVRNVIVFNPGHCSKIIGDHLGYEIHDGNGVRVFKVETKFQEVEKLNRSCYVTTIEGKFFDKAGNLVVEADPTKGTQINAQAAFGYSGGSFGFSQLTEEYRQLAHLTLQSGGAVHKVFSGKYEKMEVHIDGAALIDVEFKECDIFVSKGDFYLGGQFCTFIGGVIHFRGEASKLHQLFKSVDKGAGKTFPPTAPSASESAS